MAVNQTRSALEPTGNFGYEPDDYESSAVLRQQKNQSRSGNAVGGGLEVGGDTAQAALMAAQLGNKAVQWSAKGGQAVSRGLEKGGERLSGVGYGAGALIGVPLAGLGVLGQGAFKGVETASQEADAALRQGRQTAHQVAQKGREMRQSGFGQPQSFWPSRRERQQEADNKSLASRVIASQNLSAKAEATARKAMHAILAPLRKGLSEALKQSWLNLISSWGLTLIWIHVHVLGRFVFGPDLFVKLGDEWNDAYSSIGGNAKSLAGGMGGGNKAGANVPKFLKMNVAAQIVEDGGLVIIDLFIFGVIMLALVIIIYMVAILLDPKMMLGTLTDIFMTALQALTGGNLTL